MQIDSLPQNICDSINQTTCNFIWRGASNKGLYLVNWKKIPKLIHIGGLGVRQLEKPTFAFLENLFGIWFDQRVGTLGSNKYTCGLNFLHANDHTNSSPSWSSFIRARNILKIGYSWSASSGSSSFWFSSWSPHGLLGTLVPYIDIHDSHHSVRDVFSNNG